MILRHNNQNNQNNKQLQYYQIHNSRCLIGVCPWLLVLLASSVCFSASYYVFTSASSAAEDNSWNEGNDAVTQGTMTKRSLRTIKIEVSAIPRQYNNNNETPTPSPTISPAPTTENTQIDVDESWFISDAPSDVPSLGPTFSYGHSFPPGDVREDSASSSNVVLTEEPTPLPTRRPSSSPSIIPTVSVIPSHSPSLMPSDVPSHTPTQSMSPSFEPSLSLSPSRRPSSSPSARPSKRPSASPSTSPSDQPSRTPTDVPSSEPSSSPTLTCHDDLYYRSPINGLRCKDHRGTTCLEWRHLGLTLDDLEELIISCPVACAIDCGMLTRFDVKLSFQISKVPGLLDAATADVLNTLTRDYLSEYLRIEEPFLQFYIDNAELLSQRIIPNLEAESSGNSGDNNQPAEEVFADLWVTMAVRGFAFGISQQETADRLVSGIDSTGYTSAIQSSGNPYLKGAYAFSAAKKDESKVTLVADEVSDDGKAASITTIIVVVVVMCIGASAITSYVYHKRSPKGLPCCRHRSRKIMERERDLQSPESLNAASNVGSMFSFDDTATAGTNGLMRFISSFSRSKDSTSPGSSAAPSPTPDAGGNALHDDEMGRIPEEESVVEEEEPHPLDGLIPPMIVYDHIDDEGAKDERVQDKPRPKERAPPVVPSRRVEASSSFKEALGKRQRPSDPNDLAEYWRETSDFVTDPAMMRWTPLESRRPSPIGIVMDSDDDDEASVASTPVQLQRTKSDTSNLRRTKSMDDCSILDSVSDIILSEQDYSSKISPIELPLLGKVMATPTKKRSRHRPMASLPLMSHESPTRKGVSRDNDEVEDPTPFTWVRGGRASSSPESPSMRGPKHIPGNQEAKGSFWNRSPIAKGVKDAIWSTKRSGTPTKLIAPTTPTRTDLVVKRAPLTTAQPSTPTRNDPAAKRGPVIAAPSTPTRTDSLTRRSASNIPPSTTASNKPDNAARRSSTPTILESIGRRAPTPTKVEQPVRRNSSPTCLPMNSNSEESHGESRHSSKIGSGSFELEDGPSEEEVHFEFRAPRFGKLGLVINSSPQTGPMVEQVKDYSTLFGRVHAGDRIVEVDGAETSHMTIKEVTKRLAGKYGIRTAPSEVRIKVARLREREWNEEDVASHGSGRSLENISVQHRRNYSDPEWKEDDRKSVNSHGSAKSLGSFSSQQHRRNYSDSGILF